MMKLLCFFGLHKWRESFFNQPQLLKYYMSDTPWSKAVCASFLNQPKLFKGYSNSICMQCVRCKKRKIFRIN